SEQERASASLTQDATLCLRVRDPQGAEQLGSLWLGERSDVDHATGRAKLSLRDEPIERGGLVEITAQRHEQRERRWCGTGDQLAQQAKAVSVRPLNVVDE